MQIAIISGVTGYSWAGSEELWLGTALAALQNSHTVTACLHVDMLAAEPLVRFREQGGRTCSWASHAIARLAPLQERLHPTFSNRRLGNPDVILVSAGALTALTYVPGLLNFLRGTATPIAILCQFNSDLLQVSEAQRVEVRELLGRAVATIFVSKHNRALARRQYTSALSDAHIIYNPIRYCPEAPLPARPTDAPPVFGCVARMETLWKSQDLLLEILAQDPWSSREWTLRFFGTGPDMDHVRRCTSYLGLQDRVTFEGYVRDVAEIWRNTDLLVLPSRGEGTPLAVLEAMACGRVVVTTDVGGNAEVIEDGVSGFISPAPTAALFSATMERAWHARDRWASMGQQAHMRARRLNQLAPEHTLLGILERISTP